MKLKFNGFLALLLVLITQISFAQDIAVTGTVTDQSGLPIPGVNVLVKGTSNGTQTDFDGNFKISASQGQILVFSFLGMKTTQAPATASMKVTMADDSVQLEGVVVTALGIKRQKRELGYATVTVSAKDLTEVNNTNIFGSLSGKLAGVDINAPAQVGASTKIIIRGYSSFTQNDPLIIIDGSPVNNSGNGTSGTVSNRRTYDAGNGLGDIDPNSIESMTILKGAAATALYGSRAGSGAIIITTKGGKNNEKVKVELTSSYDSSEVARVPHQQYDFGQGWQGAGFSSLESHGVGVSAENGSWGPAFNGEVRPWGTIVDGSQQIKPYIGLKNNIRDFYDVGTTFSTGFRVSGGGENSNFSLGYNDVDSDGIIPTNSDSYKRRNLNFSAGINSQKLDVKVNLNYVKKNQKAVNTGSGDDAGEGATLVQEMIQIPSDISVVDLMDYNSKFNNPSNYFTPYASNPYFLLNENSTKIDGNRFYGNTNFIYKFNSKFSATYQIGGDYRMEKVKSYGAIVSYDAGSSQDENGAVPTVGGVTESRIERTELDSYLNLNYNTDIGESFNVNVLGGVAANERSLDQLQTRITQLDLPNYYEISNSASKPLVLQNNSMRRTFGVYGSLEASFKKRLFLTLTGRNDWTSALPEANNSYFYPSASLSGIVLENDKTFVKVRAGWSKVSKDTDPYYTATGFTQAIAGANFGTINFPIGGVNAYEYSSILGNNLLKPETTTETELGLEGNFFNRRVNLDVAVYDKKTVDLLYAKSVAASTGFTTQQGNVADVTNQGIELSLGLVPIKTENFTWNFNTTFTKNESNVDRVVGGDKIELMNGRDVTFNAQVGKPLGVYMSKVPKTNAAGQYIVDDKGYYVPTTEQQEIGNSERKFSMGFVNKFTYKNVALSFGIDWKEGGEMFAETKYLEYFVGNGIETTYNGRNNFVIPNSVQEVVNGGVTTYVENSTPISSFVTAGTGNVTNFYDTQYNPATAREFIVDKTYVRLRDISLTYNVSQDVVKRIGLVNASISFYGKNLFLWTPDGNAYIDPEVSTFQGSGAASEFGESYGTPSQRSYGTTIKLTF